MNAGKSESVDKDYGLRPLWDALLDIYEIFADICKRHGLRHYVVYGTVLGAVRHGGFIPWDDDFDVGMPREDYEKFIRISSKELPANLKFVNWMNTPEFHYLFGKIQEARRERVEALEKQLGFMLSNGVYIDIFPIDGYPESKLERAWIKARDYFLRLIGRYRIYKWDDLTWKGKVARIVGMVLAPFVPRMKSQDTIFPVYEKTAKRHKFDESTLVGDVGLWEDVLCSPCQSRECWGKPTKHDFSGHSIMIQENPDQYLISRYGTNYMTLPPVEDRKPSHSYPFRCAWWLGPTREVDLF